jgi:RNA polymerase sigma-70 factor (ECF subfamily)
LDDHSHPAGDPGSAADTTARGSLDVATLTRRMVAGDELAYRTFYHEYFDRHSHYLLVIAAGNEEAMREALQATLLRVVRHIKTFASEDAFWSWLTVLARSAYTDEVRKRRRYVSLLDRFTRHAEIEHGGRNDDPADDRLRIMLERQVAGLPADEQKLVEQKYFARRSVRDIAGESQTTEKAVESKLSRIRRKLKDALLAELKHESRS